MLELTGELAMESDDIDGLEAAKTRFQLFGMRGGDGDVIYSLRRLKVFLILLMVSEIRRENHRKDGAKTV